MSDKCPTCGKPISLLAENRFQPFCCERCKLIDLGRWFAENNRIPAGDDSGSSLPSPASDDDQVIH
ncbi:MAG TPA: DNA gyrase inhibitor YacG [Gammaproteobacteria bacterium]